MYSLVLNNIKNKLLVLITATFLATPLASFSQEHRIIQLIKRNAPNFAIDANFGGKRGQNVQLWQAGEENVNQQWYEIDRGNGYYSYQKVDTEFCLDGNTGGFNGLNVHLWSCQDNNFNQHWLKVNVGGGHYRLEKRSVPGFSLDGNNGGARGQNVHLWRSNDNEQNQHWRFNIVVNDETDIVETDREAVDFLMASSFGPTDDSVSELKDLGYSNWFEQQANLPMASLLAETTLRRDTREANEFGACLLDERFSREAWFKFAITGEDQLRQRVAFALSQIFVVATRENNIRCRVRLQGHYMDMLQEGAFGNFRDLLEEVTYHPFMASWLTYLNNAKANPQTGAQPDENYAREIMQLFTIGLTELNMDGSEKLDNSGNPIETYTQTDVTQLAKVFTGLHRSDVAFGRFSAAGEEAADTERLLMDNNFHSPGEKNVLGHTIPEYSDGNQSISDALDILAEHPNTAPFIAKHFIQRLTTSNPSPAYITAVANAFKFGSYTLPDGSLTGSGEYGDLKATVAAALLFDEARSDARFANDIFGNTYGKVREPILRFVHWARVSRVSAFNLPGFDIEASQVGQIGQDLPLRAQSVFNFFRPGYMDAGSETAEAELVAPELQIEFGPNMISYANAMRHFITNTGERADYFPNYEEAGLLARSTSSQEIVDYLNLIYTANRLLPETIEAIVNTLDTIDENNDLVRLQFASMMIVNTTEYKTQK